MDKIKTIVSSLDRDGGNKYLFVRLILDSFLLVIFSGWTLLKTISINKHLCPPTWQQTHCSNQATSAGIGRLAFLVFLLPAAIVYSIIYFIMRYRSSKQGKLSTFQVVNILVLALHFYLCVLWMMYSKALGVGVFIGFILLFGMAADVVLAIKFFMLRRYQKRDEESGLYSMGNNELIGENL
jgi:glucan phosphoethanolaminetransferase (alkaline phosphatase superfamily)